MSRVRMTALLALAMVTPAAARAQSATAWRDSADRLSRQIRALRDSMLQGDSTVREIARRGDLVIGASEKLHGDAAAALERFVVVRTRWFGGASPSPNGFRIVLRTQDSRDYYMPFSGQNLGTLVLAGLPDSGKSARTERNVARQQLADNLIDRYAELMYASAGPAEVRWLDLTPPLSMPERERRYIAMYAVVTGSGRAKRGCSAGNVGDCAYVLALRPSVTPDPGTNYPAFVRTDLLLTALELGGPGAWERFRGAAGPRIEPALAAAAGMPADSLLARWRSGLLALRPIETPLPVRGAILALGWTAALLLGALGMSRWA